MTNIRIASPPPRSISSAPDHARLLAAFDLALESEGASEATRRVYAYAARTLFAGLDHMGLGSLPVSAVTAEHVRHVLAEKRRAGAAPATLSTIHRGLRRWLGWLQEEGERTDNPMQRIAAPPIPDRPIEAPSRDQVAALIAHCRKDRRKVLGARDAAIIATLASTGLRASELCSLQVEDIDLKARQTLIVGKGGKPRIVPFEPGVLRALARYWRLAKVTEGAAFRDRSGKPLSTSGLYLCIRRRGAEIGLARLHPHALRHSWAASMLEEQVPEQAIRVLAGWAPGSRMLHRYSAHQAEALAVEARRGIKLLA